MDTPQAHSHALKAPNQKCVGRPSKPTYHPLLVQTWARHLACVAEVAVPRCQLGRQTTPPELVPHEGAVDHAAVALSTFEPLECVL